MKLLLTSAGIVNDSIKKSLIELLGKPIKESSVAYVPTAAFAEAGDKWWFVEDFQRTYELGWKQFDILPFGGIPAEMFKERLDQADVIFVEGGNQYYLAQQILANDLVGILSSFLDKKVWVGVSAGSMQFDKNMSKATPLFGEDKEFCSDTAHSPFELFDWQVRPHYNTDYFDKRDEAWAERIAARADFPIYFIDDQTAIKVVESNIEVISEGTWKLFNNN